MRFEVYKNLHLPEVESSFKQQMFKELQVVESPQTNEMYATAWRLGHQGGPEEVFYMFYDMIGALEIWATK